MPLVFLLRAEVTGDVLPYVSCVWRTVLVGRRELYSARVYLDRLVCSPALGVAAQISGFTGRCFSSETNRRAVSHPRPPVCLTRTVLRLSLLHIAPPWHMPNVGKS